MTFDNQTKRNDFVRDMPISATRYAVGSVAREIAEEMENQREIPQQEYRCQCAGCPNGKGSTFLHNHESWWRSHPDGLTPPKSCGDCREFNRQQKEIGTIFAPCKWCDQQEPVSPALRISFHKNEGSWDEHWWERSRKMVCGRCEINPGRVEHYMAKRRAIEVAKRFSNGPEPFEVFPDADQVFGPIGEYGDTDWNVNYMIDVPTDLSYYMNLKYTGRRAENHGPHGFAHIMKDGHDWLETLGTDDPELVVQALANLAAKTGDGIATFSSKEKIIKADLRTGLVVILEPSDDGLQIETGYASDNIKGKITSKVRQQENNRKQGWRPLTGSAKNGRM